MPTAALKTSSKTSLSLHQNPTQTSAAAETLKTSKTTRKPKRELLGAQTGAGGVSREVANNVVLSLTHAFEHMHHFHHDANHTGTVVSVGEKFQMPVSRYLVLHDSFLYVFKKKDSLAPLKTVWMNGCAVSVVDNSNRSNKYRFGFRICFPMNNVFRFLLLEFFI